MKLSISQLSELTGKDRRTVTAKIEGLPHEEGAKGAMLYDSVAAFDRIYSIEPRNISLDEARTRHAFSQEELNNTRNEELRKKRIAIDLVASVFDQSFAGAEEIAQRHRVEALIPRLPNSFNPDQEREVPSDLIGATIVAVGTIDEDIEGGGLVLDYRPNARDRNQMCRLVLAFNELGMWVHRKATLDADQECGF
jgi:hypothetical protein